MPSSKGTRLGKKCHKWKPDELDLLVSIVEKSQGTRELFEAQGCSVIAFWHAVAGQLIGAGGPQVTGGSCRRQYDLRVAPKIQNQSASQLVVLHPDLVEFLAWQKAKTDEILVLLKLIASRKQLRIPIDDAGKK